ncbi:GNAT family N-acetyltransferase [Sutcliffiella rhizosphaerae]|uniref:Bifunctional AAC/APH n=1 Tax=Sutcliffiella rhizosphaerae TaxID=2880967 RepID=A0ABM8YPH3_9BACI|nr:GNAT family N-acetyltransferase [Sutcliffiella rhizosphaerae]CAG9621900.1 Bifunctional AAC/APH [Sutcliffiella rhizosphaerae]
MLYQQGDMKVRNLEKRDAKLLLKWLTDSSVLQYYEGRDKVFDIESIQRKFFQRTDVIRRYIVECQNQRIGYIQVYPINKHTSPFVEYFQEKDVVGMDQFIGESAYLNKGIGTQLLTSMVQYLTEKEGVGKILMDPMVTNARAVRCYEKSGFIKKQVLSNHLLHEGAYRDCWLMEYAKKCGL